MALPKSTGLYELGLVLAMTREKGETAQQWMQRLDQGRTVVAHKLGGNNLMLRRAVAPRPRKQGKGRADKGAGVAPKQRPLPSGCGRAGD